MDELGDAEEARGDRRDDSPWAFLIMDYSVSREPGLYKFQNLWLNKHDPKEYIRLRVRAHAFMLWTCKVECRYMLVMESKGECTCMHMMVVTCKDDYMYMHVSDKHEGVHLHACYSQGLIKN